MNNRELKELKKQFEALSSEEKSLILNKITELEEMRECDIVPKLEIIIKMLEETKNFDIAINCYNAQINGDNWLN